MNSPGLKGRVDLKSTCKVLLGVGVSWCAVTKGSFTTSWQLCPTRRWRSTKRSRSIWAFNIGGWHCWYKGESGDCITRHCVFDERVLSNWEEILVVYTDVCGKAVAILPTSQIVLVTLRMFSPINQQFIQVVYFSIARQTLVLENSEPCLGCLPIFPAYCAVGKWTLALCRVGRKAWVQRGRPFLVLTADCLCLACFCSVQLRNECVTLRLLR